jgi:hypothetical protein
MTMTVEAKGADGAGPSEKHAVAGRFSVASPNGPGPRVLPNTGGAPDEDMPTSGMLGLSSPATILLGLLLVGGLGFALGRVGARRSS